MNTAPAAITLGTKTVHAAYQGRSFTPLTVCGKNASKAVATDAAVTCKTCQKRSAR